MRENLTAIPHSDAGSLEVIVPMMGMRPYVGQLHGVCSLAKWHYHPQIEIHLIREGSGQLMAGMTHAIRAGACGGHRIQSAS